MPVIEYKMTIKENGKLEVPGYVEDRGYWPNSAHTYVGWVKPESEREYWVPDTIIELTKDEFVTRGMAIHAVTPMQKLDDNGNDVDMTDAEATTDLQTWYDEFVAKNGS